ncbi:MAG: hypothetical protein IID63_03650 [candidate division Zixibacteria bacterium]|nr:hypothetical protein [candidate division Zixibacteria bacterium]
MKKTLFTLMIMLLPMMAMADFLGLKKADEFITMRVITLDSSGIRTKPDSVHVFTYLDGGTALQFNTRSTTYPFAIGIDTSKIYGDTTYWFIDQIQDIDGTPTPTDYTLTINIVMWGDGGIPTDNWGTVQVLSDSLDLYLSEIRDTTFGTIDTLQLQDDWVAREASLYDPATDSVIVDFSIWNTKDPEVTVVTNNDKTGYALSIAGIDAIADTTLNRNLSDTTNNSIFAKIMRDASAASAQAIANNTDINKVIDSLQVALDSIRAALDTLQNQDNWVLAKSDSASYMNVKSIGGQANTTSPGNLNEAFDGDATGSGRISLVESLIDLADSSIDAAAIKSYSFSTTKFAGSFLTADLLDGTAREEIWNIPFSDAATAAGSMWDSLNNSSYVQGASGLDSATLAGWVWNTPQSNHTTAGTFGKYLDLEISGIGTGSGAYSYQLVTYDSTTSQVIPGTNLAVRNINQSALIATGKSDLLGLETFNLDADSFIIVATSPGYIYQTFDTLIVTGAGIDTVFGDQFDPGSPVLPALCRVYGYLYSVSAVPEKDAVVRAFLPAGVAQSGNLIISPFMVTTTSDSSGYFYLDLIRSDSLVPAATQYDLIIERSDGTIVHKRITVPDSTSWQLDW